MNGQEERKYDYDLVVIGGGSGGLAASKQAAMLGKKVALCDFVKPTPLGTEWGLGGTCVNVGCIPKKLMHTASLIGETLHDSTYFGWNLAEKPNHSWEKMAENVVDHVRSLNWGYRQETRSKKVEYLNFYASFIDEHTLKLVGKRNREKTITTDKVILAMGGRPRYPDVPGAREFAITSDDIFHLKYHPGKVLCIGASYISLECAGFLAGIGLDVTVMVRSILLRGFDQQMANLVGDHMQTQGIKFLRRCIPTKIEEIEAGKPSLLRVTGSYYDTEGMEDFVGEFNTVIFAVGRDPCTKGMGLEEIGVKLDKLGKVVCNEREQSSVPHIYAIGDILSNGIELTPVAIQAGKLLARRLFDGSELLTDYKMVATTVFTPLEYGAIGYSEEEAQEKWGADNIEVYHRNFLPLEYTVPKRDHSFCYTKIVCVLSENEKVVGFHFLGPNAGEVTQGFALAIKLGATKADFDNLIGIHPTCAETMAKLDIPKSSGEAVKSTGC